MYRRLRSRCFIILLIMICLPKMNTVAVPCSELSSALNYPCKCELDPQEPEDNPTIFMNCDNVVFHGELPELPYGAPIVSFSQRLSGLQSLPLQLFGDYALPLRSLDFSENLLRRLTERLLHTIRGSLLELRLADNLLGDTLNPIFSTTELHGLTHLQLLDLSGNSIHAIEEGILKGCDNLQVLQLDRNSLTSVPSASLNGPRSLKQLYLAKNRISLLKSGAFKSQIYMEQLDLSSNLISTVEENAFQDMASLKVLKLSNNKLNKFNSDAFNGATNLYHLCLADNFINSFPSIAFKTFHQLRFLNLSANLIQSVDNEDLQSLLNLYQLDLSKNNIANISPGTFLGLKQLRHLDISLNSLRTIEDDAFEGLDNLESLSLIDNNILLIPASALGRLPRLNFLQLDFNRIAAISSDILSSMTDDITSLELSRNVIREIPSATFQRFHQLKNLDLSGNLLKNLSADTFSGLENTLQTLKLSQNRISTLIGRPYALFALQSLDFSNNHIIEISSEVFSLLPSLVHLNLSGNPLTRTITLPSSLLNQMPLLKIFDTSRTGISALNSDLFFKATNISKIYLSGNALTELTDGTFLKLHNLTVVDLSNNGLTNIRPRTFINTMKIQVLLLNNNKLNSFKGEIFNTGTGLEKIDLSQNELSYIYPSSFKIHPRLRWISIAENKLNFFPAELLSGLQFLEYLNLSSNSLRTINEFDFGRLPRLQTIYLSNNELEFVNEMAFHNSTQLQTLDLSNNKITKLSDRTFEGLIRLAYLDLSGNLLTELSDTLFDRSRLQMLENINLSNNQFQAAPLQSLQRQYFFVSTVDLSGNLIEDIPADNSVMVNIKKLDLSFNSLSGNSIMHILSEPKTVRELNLAGTGINTLSKLETPFLRYLNISHNNISVLSENVFERTSLLETFDASHNQITMIVPQIWKLLKNLQTLNLADNPIESISQYDFVGLESLRTLSINNLYQCMKIEKSAFNYVPNLSILNAYGYPKLGYLDLKGLLHNLPALEKLNIETKESKLTVDQIQSILRPRLNEFGLIGSRLQSVSSGILSGLKASNIVIRFCNTSLTTFPPALFFPVPRSSKIVLDLSQSQFSSFTNQMVQALDERRGNLELIGLSSNPLVCDCKARVLRQWLVYNSNMSVMCSAPDELTGKVLTELKETDLSCEPLEKEVVTRKSTVFTNLLSTSRTTEAEIIWSVMEPVEQVKQKVKPAASTGNDDTLIIGIVGGVVVFIAILIVTICLIRLRSGNSNHGTPLPAALGPISGPGSNCACSVKSVAPPMYAPSPYINGTPTGTGYVSQPQKMHPGLQTLPRNPYSTVGRVSHVYQNTGQPYFISFPADEKVYR